MKANEFDRNDSNAKRNHSKDHNLLRENIASVPSNKINYNYLNIRLIIFIYVALFEGLVLKKMVKMDDLWGVTR